MVWSTLFIMNRAEKCHTLWLSKAGRMTWEQKKKVLTGSMFEAHQKPHHCRLGIHTLRPRGHWRHPQVAHLARRTWEHSLRRHSWLVWQWRVPSNGGNRSQRKPKGCTKMCKKMGVLKFMSRAFSIPVWGRSTSESKRLAQGRSKEPCPRHSSCLPWKNTQKCSKMFKTEDRSKQVGKSCAQHEEITRPWRGETRCRQSPGDSGYLTALLGWEPQKTAPAKPGERRTT